MSTVGFYFLAEPETAGDVDAAVKEAVAAAEAAAEAAIAASESASNSASSAEDASNTVGSVDLSGYVQNDTSGIAGSSPVINFVYGTADVPPTLPEGYIYIKVDAGAP
jgi:hypothetical protein